MKKTLALLLALCMVVGLLAGCGNTNSDSTESTKTTDSTESTVPVSDEAEYTYNDVVTTLAANWNPHTYQSTDDAYPVDYGLIRLGLYNFYFNDELNPVEGAESFESYVVLPEMAADYPVDVTETVLAEHPEFGIPEDATSGYAYTIDLNPDACWEDGTPINADTYVESMERLLDPKLLNYRASDYYAGSLCIANAEAYATSGNMSFIENYVEGNYTMDDLTLGDDGQYYTPEGKAVYIALNYTLQYLGDTLKTYVDAYGDAYFDVTNWDALVAQMDKYGMIPLTDENYELFVPVTTGNENWGETEDMVPYYFAYVDEVNAVMDDFTKVGLYKSGDYQITIVFAKPLAGFNLLYNLSSTWIVEPNLYDSCLTETNGVWTSTYNTNVETTLSCGPYKITSFQTDKSMTFEKNETWYGWTDGKHVYVDPVDGETYDMFQTTKLVCQVVTEAETRKLMFLSGELATYGLQAEDFATYRSSDYAYNTPGSTIFFFILNGAIDVINNREAASDFDETTVDLQTMTLTSFRKALAVSFDKDLFVSTVAPAYTAGYGIIGDQYIYDPENGSFYRDTDQAKQALCDFYGVDTSEYASLDEAVDSITGYDPEQAAALFTEAYNEAIEAGYITDNDGDGISDQTVTMEYDISATSDTMTKRIDYLNEKLAEVTAGTPFDGKIVIVQSTPYGTAWVDKIKGGLADMVLAGWNGSLLDPFSLTDLYVNPDYQYDALWYDATATDMTLTVPVDGVDTEITMNLKDWSDALNGSTVSYNGLSLNFGDGQADVEVRLDILAALEGQFLQTYNYIPFLNDGSFYLLSQQVYYVTEDYNPVLGYGWLYYLRYEYTDAEWAAYVADQGGELSY